jgi:hypothetical protein
MSCVIPSIRANANEPGISLDNFKIPGSRLRRVPA